MNAVIYARVSSVGDRQNTDRQIDYVEYQKLELSKVFEEHISGAKKNSERPVLQEAIEYCKSNGVAILLVSELSRLGRNAFEVLATVKDLIDSGINLYMQKEQLTLLDADGKPTMFAPIMIATLSTCAQLERENIKFRLNSGRKLYIERGGKLGRRVGSMDCPLVLAPTAACRAFRQEGSLPSVTYTSQWLRRTQDRLFVVRE